MGSVSSNHIVECDHCETPISVGLVSDIEVYWCKDCITNDKHLLAAAGLQAHYTPSGRQHDGWGLEHNVRIVRSIPKKKSTNMTIGIHRKGRLDQEIDFTFHLIKGRTNEVTCLRKYYGIDCSCGCKKNSRQTFNKNVFGY